MHIGIDFNISFSRRLISFMVVFLVLQYLYIKTAPDRDFETIKIKKRIEFNLEHQKELHNLFENEINNRLSMLRTSSDNDQSKLSYNDWIAYNAKNVNIYFNGRDDVPYWLQIWRVIPDTDNQLFRLKAYPNTRYVNNSYEDLLQFVSTKFTSNHIEFDKNLIKIFFQANEKPYSLFEFFWYDPIYNRLVQRRSVVKTYDDGFGNKGTVSIGYIIEDVNNKYRMNHFDIEICSNLYKVSVILTIFITLIIYSFNSDRPNVGLVKAGLFYFILMSYIGIYMSLIDEIGTPGSEIQKLDSINQGILSMSFMTGLSIFILTNLKEDKTFLYKETSFLLIIFMIAIIIILFKNNAHVEVKNITETRIFKEFIFNYCILINVFIVINFGLNTLSI